MPIYDYECPECHNVTEVTHPMGDTPDVRCKAQVGRVGTCARKCEKIMSAPPFLLRINSNAHI